MATPAARKYNAPQNLALPHFAWSCARSTGDILLDSRGPQHVPAERSTQSAGEPDFGEHLNPPQNGRGVGQRDAALGHHLDQITRALSRLSRVFVRISTSYGSTTGDQQRLCRPVACTNCTKMLATLLSLKVRYHRTHSTMISHRSVAL
jgi:hypothetical protein